MKRLFVLAILLFVTLYLTGDQEIARGALESSEFTHQTGNSREIITLITENFENGAADWEHFDETAPIGWNEDWHLSTTGAYEGNSWWMGDEALGGYTSHRYLVLDTPVLTLSNAPELNFMFNLN
ncbi:MAG: hypothetical protein WC380_12580, partial [Pedobacter sp.]